MEHAVVKGLHLHGIDCLDFTKSEFFDPLKNLRCCVKWSVVYNLLLQIQ